ncbi:ABC transporter permease [Rhodosalinus sediminis]|uniref:ABC transporter permease n=1 Tax=Rhodosalinus sediminis TaxID=1940533 RepID=UPI002351FB53|nr:FtsX-like permease family protein [Rhodosalinus sediminis]
MTGVQGRTDLAGRRAARSRTIIRWAITDLVHERRLTILMALVVLCLIAPAMVVATARKAVIDGWTTMLETDVRNREVVVVGEYDIPTERLERIAGWPETAFLVPEPSAFVASARFDGSGGRPERLDIRTSAPGDPVLGPLDAPGAHAVVLAEQAADRLAVAAGDTVTLRLRREPASKPVEFAGVELRVAGVVPESRWPGEVAFLAPARAAGIDRWIASPGDARPPLAGEAETQWRSLRIYADVVANAPALRDRLEMAGFETRLNTDQVTRLVTLSNGLRALATSLVSLSVVGFAVAVLLLQRLAVLRKAEDLALMSVAGLSQREMTLFLLVQAGVVSLGGVALAGLLLVPMRVLIERLAQALVPGVPPASMDLSLFALGAVGTLVVSLVFTLYAARDIARLDFPQLLRND